MLEDQERWATEWGVPGGPVADKPIEPLPAGTLVTGTIGSLSMGHCRGHIWLLGAASPSTWSEGSGWVQPGTCLVCEWTTMPMDIEWWQEQAHPADIMKAANGVLEEMGRLRKVYENLTARLQAGNVTDYGMLNFDS